MTGKPVRNLEVANAEGLLPPHTMTEPECTERVEFRAYRVSNSLEMSR